MLVAAAAVRREGWQTHDDRPRVLRTTRTCWKCDLRDHDRPGDQGGPPLATWEPTESDHGAGHSHLRCRCRPPVSCHLGDRLGDPVGPRRRTGEMKSVGCNRVSQEGNDAGTGLPGLILAGTGLLGWWRRRQKIT